MISAGLKRQPEWIPSEGHPGRAETARSAGCAGRVSPGSGGRVREAFGACRVTGGKDTMVVPSVILDGSPDRRVSGVTTDTIRMGTARVPRKVQTKTDFLIVGGGMAGLAALAEARHQGISAICLEALARPGGRIRTARNRRVAPYPIELGAEFVHGPLMKQLCESLGLTLIRQPSDRVVVADEQ